MVGDGGVTLLESEGLQRPFRAAAWALPVIIAAGSIGYIYRFPLLVGNASPFRVTGVLLTLAFVFRVLSVSRADAAWLIGRLLVPAMLSAAVTVVAIGEYAYRSVPEGYVTDVSAQTVNLIVFLLVIGYVASRAALIRVLKAYVAMSFVEAAIAVYAFTTGDLLFAATIQERGTVYYSDLNLINEGDGLRRLNGTFFDPNFYGIYLVTVVALASWLLLNGYRSLYIKAAIPLSVLLVFVSVSRTAMVGLFVIAAVLFLEGRARKLVLVTGILGLLVFSYYGFLFSESPLLERLLSGQSAAERLHLMSRGLTGFANSPILGSGTNALIDPETGISTAHSMYLSVLGKFGLLGAAAYFLFVLWPLGAARSPRTHSLDQTLVRLCILPIAAMYLTYDFFQFLEFQFVVYGIAYAVLSVDKSGDGSKIASRTVYIAGPALRSAAEQPFKTLT